MEERIRRQRHIFGAAKSAGITDSDVLHELISDICGKTSLRDITHDDYLLIIKELEKRSSQTVPRKQKSTPKTRQSQGMTQGQIAKVWQLMYELRKFDLQPSKATLGERLCGIIKRELKMDAQSKEPFVWLTYKDGSTLIERLKKYVYNAEKRYLRGG